MLRRVVMLLIVWPLLLPPGVCVCDWLTTCEACAVQPSEEPACLCCHDAEADTSVGPLHTCQPGEEPADHVPACPAKDGTAQWKADTTQPLPQIAYFDWSSLVVPVQERLPDVSLALASAADAGDCPLYLTLLTLRI